MTELEQRIERWHEKKYGPVSLPATYRKLLEEVGELGEALINGDYDAVFEEAGDVGCVLSHIVRVGANNPSLHAAMDAAMDKCETRLEQETT